MAITCALMGSGEMVLPSSECTPGEQRTFTAQELKKYNCHSQRCVACTPDKPRAYIPVGRKRIILMREGFTESSFEGKFDHRFPHWAGGTDSLENLWAYPGKPAFPKDRLESYARTRYCLKKNLRMSTIKNWFMGDWRKAYARYDIRNWPL